MKRINILYLMLFILPVLSGCVTMYNPATGREEFYLISEQEEIRLGQQVALQTERRYRVVTDHHLNQRLQSVAQRIVNNSDRRNISYRFRIIEIPDQINAFAAPGGIIYVTRDLMELTNDDELACVLGHEVGHVAARHAVKKIQVSMGITIIESLIFPKEKMDEDLKRTKNITNTMINLVAAGYSREDESLSDRLGVKYAYRANFNPEGMITFLNKLKEKSKNQPPNLAIFFHSHPPYDQRIESVRQEISRLKSGQIQ